MTPGSQNSYSQNNFEEFLQKGNSLSESQRLPVELADIAYHEWYYGIHDSKLKRFKFFGTAWLLRWLFLCIKTSLFSSQKKLNLGPIDVLLFYLSTPAHTDTLNAINRNLGSDLSVLNIYKGNAEEIRILGECTCITIPEFSDSFSINFKCLRKAFSNLIRAYRALKVAGFSVSRQDYWATILEYLFRYEISVEFWRKNLPCVSVVMVTYELPVEHKALVKAAGERKIRTMHIMHGQRLPTYQITLASDVVLFSTIDRPWFEKRIPKSIRIWTSGHPRLESTRISVGAPANWLSSRKPKITFFSQGINQDYPRDQYIKDLSLLKPLKNKCELRIRPHPRESMDLLLECLAEVDIEVDISLEGLIADLKWCDAVASSWSTISMEAAVCGRGIFWTCTSPDFYPASKELREHGIGVLISKPEDWDNYLEKWQQEGWTTPVIVTDEKLRELGMIGDMCKSWAERLSIRKLADSEYATDGLHGDPCP